MTNDDILDDDEKILVKPVISNLPLAIIVVNKDRRVMLANKAAEYISGKTEGQMLNLRGGEVLGCTYADLHEDGCGHARECEVCQVRNAVIDAFKEKTNKTVLDTKLNLKDVGERDLKVSATYINVDTIEREIINRERRRNPGRRQRDLDKELVIVSVEDVTEFKQKEKLAAVVEVVGATCHEMNNPLQSVFGYLDLIKLKTDQGTLDKESLIKMVDKIYSSATRMGDIVTKLMNLKYYKTKDYLNSKILDVGEPTDK